MSNFRNWIIKKLGGITKARQEEIRLSYEKWAVANLTGINNKVTPDCSLYIPFGNDEVVIIRSRIAVRDGVLKSCVVAPWCRDVVFNNNRLIGKMK
ncbi:MAG: hypothetical protein ACI9N9_001202 [Enterobacterales bacterium]|jgi:hypothetical protein